ncbi:hypothetical protein BC938DRAFT_470498 [Jimgerdemannia flammicorona]|uniref:F-box domain-containing protein n=1 Tax=Jimgerdemannia flammicorona TaxID=994334 RepID=A0A433Q9Z6_9FUNG|nr:hypothetical protein BC938DRAFT_470498 [Jimgerdemannia flammicorona]
MIFFPPPVQPFARRLSSTSSSPSSAGPSNTTLPEAPTPSRSADFFNVRRPRSVLRRASEPVTSVIEAKDGLSGRPGRSMSTSLPPPISALTTTLRFPRQDHAPITTASLPTNPRPVVSTFAKITRQGFGALPLELRVRIFQYLNVTDVMRAARVCRSWKMLAYDGTLWSNIDVTPFYKNISGEQLLALGVAAGGFLTVANFRGCIQLTNHALRTLAECCPNVHTLQLTGCSSASSASIACFLGQATHLRVLDLSGLVNVSNHTLQTVAASCPELRKLNVAWCKNISALGIQAIARGCPKLTYLKINGCQHLDDPTMEALGSSLSILTHLCLASCTTLTDATLLSFLAATHGQLTHLNLSQCQRLTDEVLRHLATHATNLTHLELTGCAALTDPGFATLCARVQSLTYLDLEDCIAISDAAVRTISASQPNLRRLALSNCGEITDDAVTHLLTRGSCARTIEHLELDNCSQVTDAALATLAQHLATLPEDAAPIQAMASSPDSVSFFSSSPPVGSPSSAFFSPPSSSITSTHPPLNPPTKRKLSIEVYDCAKITEQGIREACRRAPPGKLRIKSFYSWRDARGRDDPDSDSDDEMPDADGGRTTAVGAAVAMAAAAAQHLQAGQLAARRRRAQARATQTDIGCIIL